MTDDDWVPARDAAAILGVSVSQISWLAGRGLLVAEQRARGYWWARRDSVEALAADRASWMSWTDAATQVGCPRSRIVRAVRGGEIETREQLGTTQPSLRRSSVAAFAEAWAAEQRQAERRRFDQEAERAARRSLQLPPDDEHVWLTTEEAALVLQLTPNGVRYRAQRELLPGMLRAGRWWFRREHVEQAAAARAFLARRSQGNGHQ